MIKHKFLLIALFSMLLFSIQNVPAADGLYQTQVSVAPNQTLDQLLPTALSQVLVKVSGNANVATIPAIQEELKQAQNYVQSYQYLPDPSQPNGKLLSVTFDTNGINDLLHQADQPVYTPQSNPAILVWLIYQNASGQKQVISPDVSIPGVDLSLLTEKANKAGIQLIWPTLDLTDLNNLSSANASALDANILTNASARYKVKVILAGSLSGSDQTGWQTQWMLLNTGAQNQSFNVNQSNLSAVYDQLLTQVSNDLRQNYSAPISNQTATTPETITLNISNVQNLDDYAKVTQYLQNLSTVTKVEPQNIATGNMIVNVTVLGGTNALLRELQIDPATNNSQPLTLMWQNGELQAASSATPAPTTPPEAEEHAPFPDPSYSSPSTQPTSPPATQP